MCENGEGGWGVRLYNIKIKVVKRFGLKCIEVLNTPMNHHTKGIFI